MVFMVWDAILVALSGECPSRSGRLVFSDGPKVKQGLRAFNSKCQREQGRGLTCREDKLLLCSGWRVALLEYHWLENKKNHTSIRAWGS